MKRIVCIFLLICILTSITCISNASTLGDVITGAEGFVGKATEQKIDESRLKDLSNNLYNVLLVIAIIASVIVGMFIGIKFITEGAQGKAEMKKAFVPYIVGNVVVFGAFGIWKLVIGILNTIS